MGGLLGSGKHRVRAIKVLYVLSATLVYSYLSAKVYTSSFTAPPVKFQNPRIVRLYSFLVTDFKQAGVGLMWEGSTIVVHTVVWRNSMV
jgi:hypothetical protein